MRRATTRGHNRVGRRIGKLSSKEVAVARPVAKALTERELELMHIYWQHEAMTAAAARDELAKTGRDLAYTTVATLSRLLCEKGFLEQTNAERPFYYKAAQAF